MLSFERYGDNGPLLVLLHWLGGSSRTWQNFGAILAGRGAQCLAINLPGFGDSNALAGFDVRAMSDAVIEAIQSVRDGNEDVPWVIGGHSMGGKVAAVVARTALDRRGTLSNLRGAFLVSPSPPSPEPMSESTREKLLKQLGTATDEAEQDRKRAEKFLDDNTGKLPLQEDVRRRAANDILRMNRTAFRAWLQAGSKEDWTSAVGTLAMPALILAGSEEPALGPEAQREKNLPHYASGEVVALQGCGHLAPLERPFEVAEHACLFLSGLGLGLGAKANKLTPTFATLLESNRVSAQTRAVMETRLRTSATWNAEPAVLSAQEFHTLRGLAECIVPNAGFDIAAQVEQRLASGAGDGWRFATLPPDVAAWRKGLMSLDVAAEREHHVPFVALHPELQRELLEKAKAGKLGKGALGTMHLGDGSDAYSADEMKQWFEEARADFTKCYMAHPATMERVGFTGFADEQGFTQIRLGQREEFDR